MRTLISDILLSAGSFCRRIGLERAGRHLLELGVQIFLPDISVRFDWSGVDLADSKRKN